MRAWRAYWCPFSAVALVLLGSAVKLASASDQQPVGTKVLSSGATADVQPPAAASAAAAAQRHTGGSAVSKPLHQEQPQRQDPASQNEQLAGSSHAAPAASSSDSVGHAARAGNASQPSQPVCPPPGLRDLFAAAADMQSRLSSNNSDADAAQQQDSDLDGVCAEPNATAVEVAAAAQLAEQAAAAAAAEEAAAAAAAGPAKAVEEDEDVHDRHNFASAKDGAKVLAANKEAKVSSVLSSLRCQSRSSRSLSPQSFTAWSSAILPLKANLDERLSMPCSAEGGVDFGQ